MLNCSYCPSPHPTDLLLCCLTLTCSPCLSTHPCLSTDTLPLSSKHPTLKLCRRCNLSPITHKCTQCNKLFCQSCKTTIHKGKLLKHEIIEIEKMHKGGGSQALCGRHELKRNMVMENGSVGCVRCGEEAGLRRVGMVEEMAGKGVSAEVAKQVLEQKRLALENDKALVDSKWTMIQKSARNIFNRLITELEQRQKYTLQRISTIKAQQLSTLTHLLSLTSIQKSSLQSLQKTTLPNKDKLLKLKLISIDQNLRIIDRKKKIPEYHIGKLQIQSLISAVKGLVSIDRVKQDPADRRRSSDILESNRKDRRSQSKDLRSSRVSQMSMTNLHQSGRESRCQQQQQSGMKTRENSVSMLNIPVVANFQKKLTESVVVQAQKTRMKSEVVQIGEIGIGGAQEEMKKSQQVSQKFKSNFLQMKENIRKSGNYMNQRPLTRR